MRFCLWIYCVTLTNLEKIGNISMVQKVYQTLGAVHIVCQPLREGGGVSKFLIFFWKGGADIVWPVWLSLNKHAEMAKKKNTIFSLRIWHILNLICCLNCYSTFFFLLKARLNYFLIQSFFLKGVFYLTNWSATKDDFLQGGFSQVLTFLTREEGKRIGQFLTFGWQGGAGG